MSNEMGFLLVAAAVLWGAIMLPDRAVEVTHNAKGKWVLETSTNLTENAWTEVAEGVSGGVYTSRTDRAFFRIKAKNKNKTKETE